jgi:hypothetical protein
MRSQSRVHPKVMLLSYGRSTFQNQHRFEGVDVGGGRRRGFRMAVGRLRDVGLMG